MKRFLTLAIVGLVGLGAGSVAYANVCSVDVVPAASLLFPYVVYDYEGGNLGDTTIFTITNTSSEAQIVHITVWTDWSFPILDYNIVLTGYDVYRQNIRNVLRDGILPGPLTGDTTWANQATLNLAGIGAGTVPIGLGPYSEANELIQPPITIADLAAAQATRNAEGPANLSSNLWDLNCNPNFQGGGWLGSPNNYTFPIDDQSLAFFEDLLKASQTAVKGFYCNTLPPAGDVTDEVLGAIDNVWWFDRESGPVQFYITADVVGNCNKLFPNSPTFWVPYEDGAADAVGVVKYDNVLMGDIIYLNAENNFSEAVNAVHLEAIDPRVGRLGSTVTPLGTDVSFYHRYTLQEAGGVVTQPWSDGREPLPTAWAFRYQYNENVGIDTWLRVFKQSSTQIPVSMQTTATPDLYPIPSAGNPSIPGQMWASTCQPYTYYSWDEDENVAGAPGGGFQPPWSGTPPVPAPIPNVASLGTQEFEISALAVVETSPGVANGWMLFVWPPSNGNVTANRGALDIFQTHMGVKIGGFGTYTAAMDGTVMGHYGCDDTQVLPNLGWGIYAAATE